MTPLLEDLHAPRETVANGNGQARIVIGLVNNMPDAALRATERQFQELLFTAGSSLSLRLRLFALPGIPRGSAAQLHLLQHYEDISELWASDLDGLIVTGAEPHTPDIKEEPFWRSFEKLVDWAEDHTTSTIWSCLAAHAAVLHLDGIERRPYHEKLSGVFACIKAADHPILAGVPPHWCIPHSRYNGLPEPALVSCGYGVLSRLSEAGVDMFSRRGRSLFLFFQGHPEYGPDTLLREYRRDIGRFLAGERDSYPPMPRGLLSMDAVAALSALRRRALLQHDVNVLQDFPAAVMNTKPVHAWQEIAVDLYENWLSCLAGQKTQGAAATMPCAPAVSYWGSGGAP
ncbi:MAG TPA: homoserine O-succinyltransferase [Acetobacteraceae bacterium]